MAASGGSIELSGFKGIDEPALIVLKKLVGGYAKRFSRNRQGFEKLSLHLKKVHAQEHSEKYEICASLAAKSRLYTSTTTDLSLFFAVEAALKKIERELGGK